jgi:zinc protease
MKNLSILSLFAILFLIQCTPKTSDVVQKSDAIKELPTEVTGESTTKAEFRKNAPTPGPAPKIQIGSSEQFTLENGLKVIVVENHKIPRVSFSLTVDMGTIPEKEFAGYTSMAGQLLSKGTNSKTKAQIDEEVDFMGASLRTNSRGMFAASLRKHTDNLLKIMSDVLLNPSFPQEEFEKIKKQTISGLASSKDDPNAIASNVAAVLRYGKDHPYGEIVTEKTVENITIEKCVEYYHHYFKPNISYLIVVGDITVDEAKPLVENYFGSWNRGEVEKKKFETPKAPEKSSVDFVNKAGAVQSIISVTYPVDLKPGAEDAIKARVMNTMLGGFFASRLNGNLREDKAYTYGARSSLSSDEEIGFFAAGASVRNEVTDSSIVQLLSELNKIRDEKADAKELNLVKNYLSGSFARSLENPQTVARFSLNTIRYNLPEDYYATYLEKLSAVTAEDVQMMAKKYVTTEKAHILVVGNKDEVAEKLEVFVPDGKLNFYDNYGEELKANMAIPEGMTAEKVIEDYLNALGGVEKLKGIKDLATSMAADMQGRKLSFTIYQTENKFANIIEMEGMGEMARQVYNEGKGLLSQMGQPMPVNDDQLAGMKEATYPFIEMMYKDLGYKTELKGMENIEGADAYVVSIETPEGDNKTQYFAVETSLKLRELEVKDAGGRSVTEISDFADYKEIDGIMFPHKMTVTGMMPMPLQMIVSEIKVNKGIDDSVFATE